MRILLLTRYGRPGASSRLRAYQYLPYLRSQGFEITALPFFDDSHQQDLYEGRSPHWGKTAQAYLRRCLQLVRSPTFNLVWIEYELFPWLPALAERLLARLKIPYVVDYDDAIYHRYDLHPNRIVRFLLGKKTDEIMRRASAVIVGNDYLAERAHAAGARRVEHLPTVVDLERYPTASSESRNGFTIGWIGSPSTVKYLSLVEPVLAEFCRAGKARLVVVGARATTLNDVPTEIRPWSEATEVDDIHGFDVGVMPLPDEPWERGKCGYKLIQYMACACPVIASPIGVTRHLVEQGVNGFLATTHQEWRTALGTLRASPDLRALLGNAGRRKVETGYCTQVTAPRLAVILRRAASDTSTAR